MPTYEFSCKCGNNFEKFCAIGEKITNCTCGKKAVKIPSVPNFILKGGGFFSDEKMAEQTGDYVKEEVEKMKKEIF